MKERNFSPREMFMQLARDHQPAMSCTASTLVEFSQWKKRTLPEVIKTLGTRPASVEPRGELIAEWEHDGLRKQRWLIDVLPHLSATFLINYPAQCSQAGAGETLPAILCWHGHGPYGKEPVMGNNSSPGLRQSIAAHNYDYGHQMAKAGFITYAVDWIGMGEHNDAAKPNPHIDIGGRDWCNIYYLHATMLGTTSISINVAIGRAATDFACTLDLVDPRRLGVMGLSGGGTMTLWSTLCDERFRASEIICYSGRWPDFGFRDANYCGMQVSPGLFALVHLHDLQGLIAPRPLLVDIGSYDTCFTVDDAMACYREVERIYSVAEAPDRLELDLFPGEHGWGGNRSVAFFSRHLAAAGT